MKVICTCNKAVAAAQAKEGEVYKWCPKHSHLHPDWIKNPNSHVAVEVK